MSAGATIVARGGSGNGVAAKPGSFTVNQQAQPISVVRPSFVFLAGALPSARVDEEYWAVLATELADIPEPILQAAVRQYVRSNENAYRMPTVAELLKLSSRLAEEQNREEKWASAAARAEAQEAEYNELMAGLKAVLDSVPQEDWIEVQRRMTAAYETAADWTQASRAIVMCLLDMADAPDIGWYCPTELVALRLWLDYETYEQAYGKPYGSPTAALNTELADRLAAAFPGRFRVRYQNRLAHLLDPDRFYLS